jgi:hypothetical protein
MPRKAKAQTGTVEFVNKPETAPEPSILAVVPPIEVPEQGSPTSAPPPPVSPVLPVKGKRTYNKKNGEYWKAVSKDRKGMLMPKPEPKVEPVPEPKNEIIMPTPEVVQEAPKKAKGRPRKVTAPPPTPVPVPTPPPAPPAPVKQKKEKKVAPIKQAPPPKPVKPVKAKPVKKVRVYEPSSDEESDDYESEESESDDEAPVEVVAKKAVRRLKTLKKIDERIGQLNNSYSARGYSVF